MYMARKKELLVLILRGISPEKPSNNQSSKNSMTISKSKYYHLHALNKQQNIKHIQIIFFQSSGYNKQFVYIYTFQNSVPVLHYRKISKYGEKMNQFTYTRG